MSNAFICLPYQYLIGARRVFVSVRSVKVAEMRNENAKKPSHFEFLAWGICRYVFDVALSIPLSPAFVPLGAVINRNAVNVVSSQRSVRGALPRLRYLPDQYNSGPSTAPVYMRQPEIPTM